MTWQTLGNHRSELGESPFWHPVEQQLYWVDIQARQILRCKAPEGTVEVWPMEAPYALEPGCIAPAARGGLVVALRDGVYRATHWRGPLTRIAAFDFDTTRLRFNDGKCDPEGRFWAGTVNETKDRKDAELYCVDARSPGAPVVHTMLSGVLTANGVAWSPDGGTLYWSDTPSHLIRAWQRDPQTNALSGERVFREFAPKPAGWRFGDRSYLGRPDGCAIDVEGHYYVAMYEGARVLKLSAQGEVLADYPTPVQCPTMPCFGGPDLKTLYLTSARHGRSVEELSAHPLSGVVFSMRVEVPGLPVNVFAEAAST